MPHLPRHWTGAHDLITISSEPGAGEIKKGGSDDGFRERMAHTYWTSLHTAKVRLRVPESSSSVVGTPGETMPVLD